MQQPRGAEAREAGAAAALPAKELLASLAQLEDGNQERSDLMLATGAVVSKLEDGEEFAWPGVRGGPASRSLVSFEMA